MGWFIWVILIQFSVSFYCQAFYCDNGVQEFPETLLCNDYTQCSDCSDEKNCTGSSKMWMPCDVRDLNRSLCFLPSQRCNGVADCYNCEDEKDCPNSLLFHCLDGSGCVTVYSSNSSCRTNDNPLCDNFCDGVSQCHDKSDERYIGFGFKCLSGANPLNNRCIIPQSYVKRWLNTNETKPSICVNDEDNCYTNKGFLNTAKCWPCLNGEIVRRAQICDKVFDCADLSDECLCEDSEICQNLFKNDECKASEIPCSETGPCIQSNQICDDVTHCENGFDEKYCSRCKNCTNEIKECDGKIEDLNGSDECNSECPEQPEYCPHISLDNRVRWENVSSCQPYVNALCDGVLSCEDAFDELYCPLRILCNSSDISQGSYYNDSRCDHIFHCQNRADEMNCASASHFYCDNNQIVLQRSQLFDGRNDCFDFSDECQIQHGSVSSRTRMIASKVLYAILWLMSILAIVGNGIVIGTTANELASILRRRMNTSSNRVGVCNKTMILNLAVSDFLMGFYLLYIACKALVFSDVYCEFKLQWLSSWECSFIGVISVLSAETSVLIMTLMTTYRLYGVINPFRVEKIRLLAVNMTLALIWILGFIWSIVPVLPWQSNTFTSSLIVKQPYIRSFGLNISTINDLRRKAEMLPTLNLSFDSYPNLFTGFQELFPDEFLDPTSYITLGYYASDSVCIPRFYSSPEEPAAMYSIGMICINSLAFVYMFVAYAIIYRLTSQEQGKRNNENYHASQSDIRLKENRVLWGKIVKLVFTNFCCWIPICTMSFLAFAGVGIPHVAYVISATVLFPINSAINPWIYSSVLWIYLRKCVVENKYIKQVYSCTIFKKKHIQRNKNPNSLNQAKTVHKYCYFGCLKAEERVSMDISLATVPNSVSITQNTMDGCTLNTEV